MGTPFAASACPLTRRTARTFACHAARPGQPLIKHPLIKHPRPPRRSASPRKAPYFPQRVLLSTRSEPQQPAQASGAPGHAAGLRPPRGKARAALPPRTRPGGRAATRAPPEAPRFRESGSERASVGVPARASSSETPPAPNTSSSPLGRGRTRRLLGEVRNLPHPIPACSRSGLGAPRCPSLQGQVQSLTPDPRAGISSRLSPSSHTNSRRPSNRCHMGEGRSTEATEGRWERSLSQPHNLDLSPCPPTPLPHSLFPSAQPHLHFPIPNPPLPPPLDRSHSLSTHL